jgi:16S rRNA (uracil1498-N3)-methyltransferase
MAIPERVGHNTSVSVPRFYHPTLQAGDLDLGADEARHATGARRLRPGDAVVLFDGIGHEADAQLVGIDSRRVLARIEGIRSVPRSAACDLTIAVSLPRRSRQDTLIEKCTELGVATIRPIGVERTMAEASTGRMERWRRVSIAAAKQSQQAWLPELREPAAISEVLELAGEFDLVLLADASPEAWSLPTLLEERREARTILAFIGPEGGFTDQERAMVISHRAEPCRLTPTILRVETAAIALASVVLCRPRD